MNNVEELRNRNINVLPIQLTFILLKGFLHFTRDDHRDAKNLSCLIPSLGLRCGSEAVVVNWKPDSPSVSRESSGRIWKKCRGCWFSAVCLMLNK